MSSEYGVKYCIYQLTSLSMSFVLQMAVRICSFALKSFIFLDPSADLAKILIIQKQGIRKLTGLSGP
jgi:hypothetical protein